MKNLISPGWFFPCNCTGKANQNRNLCTFEKLVNKVLHVWRWKKKFWMKRGRSRTAATSKVELFAIIVNGFKPLNIITKCSILDVAAVLDLLHGCNSKLKIYKRYMIYRLAWIHKKQAWYINTWTKSFLNYSWCSHDELTL